nr:copper-binding protein [Aquabacterium sp. J223]
MKWGPMMMEFKPPARDLPAGLKAGETVSFEFFMDSDGLPQLTAVRRSGGGK